MNAGTALLLPLLLVMVAACAAAPTPAPSLAPSTAPQPTAPLASPAVPSSTPAPAPIVLTSTLDVTYTVAVNALANSYALDVYAPAGRSNLPVVVFLHGTGENRRGYARFSRELAEAGFVVFTADWAVFALGRGAQDGGRGYREALESAACAVRYARASAGAYGGDVRRVTLAGFSAGGAVASLLAFQGDQPETLWSGYEGQGGPPRQLECVKAGDSARTDALIAVAGVFGMSDSLRASQPQLADVLSPPRRLETRKDLRVRLLHSAADSLVPLAQSQAFAAMLAAAGLDVQLIEHTGAHAVPVPQFIETLRQLWK